MVDRHTIGIFDKNGHEQLFFVTPYDFSAKK